MKRKSFFEGKEEGSFLKVPEMEMKKEKIHSPGENISIFAFI